MAPTKVDTTPPSDACHAPKARWACKVGEGVRTKVACKGESENVAKLHLVKTPTQKPLSSKDSSVAISSKQVAIEAFQTFSSSMHVGGGSQQAHYLPLLLEC
jgi:hypothetical protein